MAENDPSKVAGTAADRALRDAAQQAKAVEKRDTKLTERDELRKYGEPTIIATINPPHQVLCRGKHLVIKINNADAPAAAEVDGGDDEHTDKQVIISDNGVANYYFIPAQYIGAV